MQESSKTNRVRGPEFLEKYCAGKVIDIGCGTDLVVPHAEPFDMEHGDANEITKFREAGTYDAVHSSHCLEHMHEPAKAIAEWWKLLKPGGYFIIVVPDEDLYEQGVWPSRFNADHKATFRLKTKETWSPCSHDLYELVKSLPGANVISADIHDQGYNHAIQNLGPENVMSQFMRMNLSRLYGQLSQKKLLSLPLLDELNVFFSSLGATVDQTVGSALAQMQVVAQKAKK